MAMSLLKIGRKKKCETLIVAMALPKLGEKKIVNREKKKFVLAIVAMALPKMEGKKKNVTKYVKE